MSWNEGSDYLASYNKRLLILIYKYKQPFAIILWRLSVDSSKFVINYNYIFLYIYNIYFA